MRPFVFASAFIFGCNGILGQHPGILAEDAGEDATDECACVLDHATSLCAKGVCSIVTCEDGWVDVDGNPANGCEIADPSTVGSLAVWFRADKGVTTNDGGVVGWQSQGPKGGTATTTKGNPTLDTGSWPGVALPSVRFGGSDTMGVDLSSMMNKDGCTMFLALARYGDYPYNCVLGSPTYPTAGFICCPPGQTTCNGLPNAAGTALQLGWVSNTKTFCEPFCSAMDLPIAANGATSFQAVVMTMWFDPSAPRSYHYSLDDDSTSIQSYVSPLTNLSSPAILGACPSGPAYFGLVGELIVYEASLLKADRDLVHAYLKARWKTH